MRSYRVYELFYDRECDRAEGYDFYLKFSLIPPHAAHMVHVNMVHFSHAR